MTVFTALMAKLTTMPASMPDATEAGMREISLVNGLSTPVRISSNATMMKAPTASFIVKPVLAATSAAPGVDHAEMMGMRVRQLSHAVSSAMARQIAVTQLAVWSCVAPTALAAAMISASVPPKPTIAATNAEVGMDSAHGQDGSTPASAATALTIISRSCGRDSRWSPSGISDTVRSSAGRWLASFSAWLAGTSGSARPCRMWTGQCVSIGPVSTRFASPSSNSALV